MANNDSGNGQVQLLRSITLISSLAIMFVTWGITIGTLFEKVKANEKVCETVTKHEIAIVKIQGDICYIRKGVDEIKNGINGSRK